MEKTIEYNRIIFGHKDGADNYEKDLLLLIEEAPVDNPTERKWKNIASFGWAYQLWPDIGERAGHCEVGNILLDGQRVNMGKYIALYRESLQDVQPADLLFERFDITGSIELKGDGNSCMDVSDVECSYETKNIRTILSENKLELIKSVKDGIHVASVQFQIRTIDTLRAMLSRTNYSIRSRVSRYAGAMLSLTFQQRSQFPTL